MEVIGTNLHEYHRYPISPFHITVAEHKNNFYDRKNKDRDWKLKQCVLAVISEKSEIELGFNLWKLGLSGGQKNTLVLESTSQRKK